MNPLSILKSFNQATPSSEGDLGLFSLRGEILQHRRLREVICLIAELHQYSLENVVGGGLLVSGPSGVGKTSLLRSYAGWFPADHQGKVSTYRVLSITTPSSPTVKSLAEAILVALGDPMARKGSAEEKTFRIYKLLAACNVELLIIDEFQHFYYTHSVIEFRRISDWLKNLISLSGLAVVLAGLPESEVVIKSNEQLNRRFSSRYYLSGFTGLDPDDFDEFRAILKVFDAKLPIRPLRPLHEANLARRFLVASNGLLDYVRKILETSVAVASSAAMPTLDLPIYALAFRRSVSADISDRLNPFHPESPLRILNKQGEPFYSPEFSNGIGSPLARRSISAFIKKENK